MANNDGYPTTPGAGRNILVDVGLTAPDGTTSVDVQGVKVFAGPAGATTGFVDGSRVNGATNDSTGAVALFVDPRPKALRLQVTAVTSTTPAYSAKDNIGGALDFGTASRATGGSCTIVACQVVDKANTPQDAAMDLVLFDRAISAPTDNAVFAPTDAEALECIGVIPIGAYADFNVNSVAHVPVSIPVVLNGTHIFGYLVSRGTPTYTSTNDVVVTLTVYQD